MQLLFSLYIRLHFWANVAVFLNQTGLTLVYRSFGMKADHHQSPRAPPLPGSSWEGKLENIKKHPLSPSYVWVGRLLTKCLDINNVSFGMTIGASRHQYTVKCQTLSNHPSIHNK